MEQTNEVHAALSKLRDAGVINKEGAPDQRERQPSDRARAADGTLVSDQETAAPSEAVPGPIKRFWNICTEPFTGIANVLHELSPKGLIERGIPFTSALHVPRSVLVSSIIINLFGLALPLVILQVYDRVIPNQAHETFSIMMMALAVIALFEAILRVSRSYVLSWAATRFTTAITQELISRFLYAPSGSFSDNSPAKTIERLSNINRVADFYGGQSRLMFIDLPFAGVFLGVMAIIGGWLVIVPFLILCLFGFATITSSRHYKKILEEKEEHEARTYDFVAETLQGILTMKSQSAESLLMRRFERLQAKNAQLHYSIITAAMQGQSIASLLGNGTMIAMVTTGAFLAVNGHMTVGVLACCSLLSGRAVQPILRVAGTWNEFQRARIAVEEVSRLFELNNVPDLTAIVEDPPTPEIVAKDLVLELGNTGRQLGQLSFEIESGEAIALVGPDGSGKSTLLSAIAGLRLPDSGSVTLDDLSAYDFRRRYQSAVGLLDTNTEVFSGTIFENLTLFGQGGSAEEVRWATDIVGLEKDIDKLPQGYDTPLGRGIAETLPAGFIGRLLMARVLAQKPVMWALDEPQTALDGDGIKSFLQALDNLRGWITFAYTTNSEEFMRAADRIFYIQDGELTVYDNVDEMKAGLAANEFDRVSVDDTETGFNKIGA
ncbi:MAG: ABC transporter transmembrane domain-containing protein [Hyphomicrobiales bacterium]